MTPVIRGVGVYHPDGAVDGIDDSARHVPADHDLAGEGTRELLVRMRDQALELPGGFAWIGLLEPTKPELAMVAEIFALEQLQVEDAANPRQRAKVDISEEGELFTVLKTLGYDGEAGEAGEVEPDRWPSSPGPDMRSPFDTASTAISPPSVVGSEAARCCAPTDRSRCCTRSWT